MIVLQNREQKLLVRLYTIQNQPPLKWQLCLYAKNTYTRAYHMHINWLKKNVTEIFTKVLRQDIDNTIQNPNETWKELRRTKYLKKRAYFEWRHYYLSCQNTKKHNMLNFLSLPPRNCTQCCFPEGGKISKGGNTCTVFPLFLPREFEFLCRKHTAAYWCHLLRGGKIRRLYYSYVEMGRNGMTTDDQNLKWKKPGAALTSICF